MISKNSKRAIVGTMNLLAISSPILLGSTTYAKNTNMTNPNIESLNFASLKSMESTWLEVPMVCKARAFNASPITLNDKSISSSIHEIYNTFGA